MPLIGLAGHGRISEAETVRTVATKVNPNSEETNERRCVRRRTLYMDILERLFRHMGQDFILKVSQAKGLTRPISMSSQDHRRTRYARYVVVVRTISARPVHAAQNVLGCFASVVHWLHHCSESASCSAPSTTHLLLVPQVPSRNVYQR